MSLTLLNMQTIHVTEPPLNAIREQLVDAVDLRDGRRVLVTQSIGYDANTFTAYGRSCSGTAN